MNNNKSKERNIRYILTGIFFTTLSTTLVHFFLPFFLQEKGLSALEIGGLFTVSLAIGTLFFNVIFSKIIRKIKLKQGLILEGIFAFLQTGLLYFFPTTRGVGANQITKNLSKQISFISKDVAIQHNLIKSKERLTSINWLILDGMGLMLGIFLSVILVTRLGFKYSFLIFSLLALPSIYLYSKVNDKTRFKPKEKIKLPKVSRKLKILLFSEIIYWLALSSSFALVITFLVTEKLSGSIVEIGILFGLLYLSMTLTTIFLKNKLNRFKDIDIVITGMIILLISAILLIITKNFYIVSLAFVLEGIGAGIWVPSKTALQWKYTKKENREKVSGWLSGLRGFVQSFGPLIGGFLITVIGINAPFYFKAGISIVSLGIYFYIKKINEPNRSKLRGIPN